MFLKKYPKCYFFRRIVISIKTPNSKFVLSLYIGVTLKFFFIMMGRSTNLVKMMARVGMIMRVGMGDGHGWHNGRVDGFAVI